MLKNQYFNSIKFIRDEQSGYYLSAPILFNGRQERMHRYVWRHHHGSIPDGHHIHHIDGNKGNNDISNLALIRGTDHISMHVKEYHELNGEKVKQHLDNIRPMTKEWHASDEGRDWHKAHYEEMKEKLHIRIKMTCDFCNKEFDGLPNHSKVCSNKCKSALRRQLGIDDIIKKCEVCNNEFSSNKYAKVTTCTRSCAAKLRWNKRNKTQD